MTFKTQQFAIIQSASALLVGCAAKRYEIKPVTLKVRSFMIQTLNGSRLNHEVNIESESRLFERSIEMLIQIRKTIEPPLAAGGGSVGSWAKRERK